LQIGAAIEAGDRRRRALELRSQSMTLPDPANCIALDDSPPIEPKSSAGPAVKYAGPIMASVFEPLDRGPPITGTLPPIAAGGQRSRPDHQE
jgi:hypothetical protein